MGTKMLVRFPREQGEITVFSLCVSAPIAAANLVSDPPQLAGLATGSDFNITW
jgi:hypothetical protein